MISNTINGIKIDITDKMISDMTMTSASVKCKTTNRYLCMHMTSDK